MLNNDIQNILLKLGIDRNIDKLNIKIMNELNQVIIYKLLPELKKLLIKKNIFYDINVNAYRIKQNNTNFTYSIEHSLTMILRQPFIFFEIDIFSLFSDIEWYNIVYSILDVKEIEIYNNHRNYYIHSIVLNLFYNNYFYVENKNVDLLIEFDDIVVYLSNSLYCNISDIDFSDKTVVSALYSKLDYLTMIFPIYFVHILSIISTEIKMFTFLYSFFFEYAIFIIGFYFSKKTITEVININIELIIEHLIFILKTEINKEIESLNLDINIDVVINNFVSPLHLYLNNIMVLLYSNTYVDFKTDNTKFEIICDTVKNKSVANTSDKEYLQNFKYFLDRLIYFSLEDELDTGINECNNYIETTSFLLAVELKRVEDKSKIKLFMNSVQNNYYSKLVDLYGEIDNKEISDIASEMNKLFGKDEFVYFIVLCVMKYNMLVASSKNFSTSLDMKYYNLLLKFFINNI